MSTHGGASKRTAAEIESAGPVDAVLGDDGTTIETLRQQVTRLATRGGFADRADDLALALVEVLANALEHGKPPVRVRAWLDGRLVIEVADQGSGFDLAIVPDSPPTHHGHRGRGLWIVRQLVDVMKVRHATSGPSKGSTVRIELSPEPHIGA